MAQTSDKKEIPITEDTPEEILLKKNRIVEKYQSHFTWLKDPQFLQDLANDSVDSDIIEEELSALHDEQEPPTAREKVVKFLQSNPVQILLVVVVLLDAGIVIAQIVLDLNSVKEKLHRRDDQLLRLLTYLKDSRADELHGYTGNDVNHILQILEDHSRWNNLTDEINHGYAKNSSRIRDDGSSDPMRENKTPGANPVSNTLKNHTRVGTIGQPVTGSQSHSFGANAKGPPTAERTIFDGESREIGNKDPASYETDEGDAHAPSLEGTKVIDCNVCMHNDVFHASTHFHHVEHHEEHDSYREVAHGLHFASIAILGFLVVEDLIKIIAMGREFFKHKIEIFDAIIIVASFISDIVFLGGVSGEEGQKAAAVLVVLLVWRIARVADGILITVKQRQEFRIRLQKRARRSAERKLDLLEEERHGRMRQIQALKDLCLKGGLRDEDIDACAPRHPRRVSSTMCALTSVARLSVSMTMSMSSGLFSLIDDDPEKVLTDDHKQRNYVALRKSSLNNDGSSPRFFRRALDIACSPKQYRKSSESTSPKSHRKSNGRSSGGGTSPPKAIDIKGRHNKSVQVRPLPTPPPPHPGSAPSLRRHSHVSPINSSGVEIVIDSGSEPENTPPSPGGIRPQAEDVPPPPQEYSHPTFGLYPEDSLDSEEEKVQAKQHPEKSPNGKPPQEQRLPPILKQVTPLEPIPPQEHLVQPNLHQTEVQIEATEDEVPETEVEETEADAFLSAVDALNQDQHDDQHMSNSSQVYLLSEMS